MIPLNAEPQIVAPKNAEPAGECFLRNGQRNSVWLPNGKIVIWWRGKCRLTGKETKFISHLTSLPGTQAVMQEWVERHFHHLDFIDFEPWEERAHGHGVLYPVPVQHILHDPKRPDVSRPDATRKSLLIQAKPLAGRSLLQF